MELFGQFLSFFFQIPVQIFNLAMSSWITAFPVLVAILYIVVDLVFTSSNGE